mmetsp:Transcript_22310/g.88562  ORF Transcript_22310/g.88562 Transcript_22310/m.88562 type:complete len:294 (-) Transcript_22310:351-1232(-)
MAAVMSSSLPPVCVPCPATGTTKRQRPWCDDVAAGEADEAVAFDFEDHIGLILPQLNEPGHLNSAEARKAAVEAAAVSAPPGMSVQKLEEKYRTVVCRHWLRNLCMKGEQCEFLHQYDVDRMPLCRWGIHCKVPDCQYRHVAEDDKPQCVFYQQGFCIHGLSCKYRHVKQPADKRPKIADFSLGIAQTRKFGPPGGSSGGGPVLGGGGPGGGPPGDRAGPGPYGGRPEHHRGPGGFGGPGGPGEDRRPPPNEYFKISLCKHHMNGGLCPYGDDCHFAHGQHELRPFRGRIGSR